MIFRTKAKALFGAEHCRAIIAAAVNSAGVRYTPEINVDVPLAKVFRGLGRTPEFFDELSRHKGLIRKELESINIQLASISITSREKREISKLFKITNQIIEVIGGISPSAARMLPFERLSLLLRNIRPIAAAAESILRETEKRLSSQEAGKPRPESGIQNSEKARGVADHVRRLDQKFDEFENYMGLLQSEWVILA